MATMMHNWRDLFAEPRLPFLLAELALWMPESDVAGRTAWDEMRQVQRAIADADADAYFVPNKDLGEWNDIHPLDKKTLGQRAAAIALQYILK
jgi:sialate O-acetylesterase